MNSIATSVLENESPFLNEEGQLNIPNGAERFIDASLGTSPNPNLNTGQIHDISIINERKDRLTEDNLIFSSNYTYTKNTKSDIQDADYHIFKTKVELAGNYLYAFSKLLELDRNSNNRFEIFGVEYSQYAKTEISYTKHWDFGRKNILATRFFGGIAIPFTNANSIPFARSFFSGGPNDNRAWLAYDLGPGSTGGRNEFNEANMKIALNLEYRYNILGSLHGAFFIDTGNIWNVLDNVDDEEAVFSKWDDLQELAVGSGVGFRYDFNFFVIRLDIGFKTFNPANDEDQRWFKGYNLSKAVYNVGINYPF